MQKSLTTIVQLSKNKYIEKETGYLICENATLGSTGMQEYFAGDLGIEDVPGNVRVKVYRPEEEVFKPESLASLENKAFTVYHPDEMVNSVNDSKLRKGSVYNVRREGNTIVGDIQVTDQDTIDKLKHIRCLSLGYNLDLDKMEDAENSYIARNIRYNHLALVPKGRSKVAQINDSDQEFMEDEYMSIFHRNIKVSDAEEEKKAEDVEKTESVEKEEKEEVKETVKDKDSEEVKDGAEEKAADSEEEAKDCSSKDEELKDCGSKDEELKDCNSKDEEEKAEDCSSKDEDDKEEAPKDDKKDEDDDDKEAKDGDKEVVEEFEEKKKEIKDGGDMTLEEINALNADVRAIALEEYKAKMMANKNLVYGDENAGFTKPVEEPKPAALDAETERKLYYKNTLNPHKNKDWRKECVLATSIDL